MVKSGRFDGVWQGAGTGVGGRVARYYLDCAYRAEVEEVLKAVMAQYTDEELITQRGEVKTGVDVALTSRLATYHLAVDDISLVHVHFSERFSLVMQ